MNPGGRSETGTITRLLSKARAGDAAARDEVLRKTQAALRSIARRHIARCRAHRWRGETSLVHDALLKLLKNGRLDAKNRDHFLALMKCAMHDELVDRIRHENTQANGGGWQRVPLLELSSGQMTMEVTGEELEKSLDELERMDAVAARVFMLITVYGCSIKGAGRVLGLTPAVARDNWEYSRSWLALKLRQRLGGAS